jgi:hypothetical protein
MTVKPDFQRGADIGARVRNGKPSLQGAGSHRLRVTPKAQAA